MSVVLDAGALVAVERGHGRLAALLKRESLAGRPPLTHGGIIGQVWRSGTGRQASLARVVEVIDVRPLDEPLGRRSGELLGRAGRTDVIDAAVVLLARDGDRIYTSDPSDLRVLAEAAERQVDLVQV